MDGGRILRALLAFRFSYLTATWIAVLVARPLALAGIGLTLYFRHSWLLAVLFAFVIIGGQLEYNLVKRKESGPSLSGS